MHQQGSSFDLSNLQRNCIFRCESPMESHEKIAHELADHDLRWRRGAVDTGMYKVGVHALEMFMLHYGAEVEVRPRVPEGFALVHLSLKGAIDIISDEQRITVSPGEVAYLAPRKNFRMLWQRGAQQLILKVPDTLLRSIVAEAGACLDLPSTMRLTPAAARQWHLFMQSLLNIGTAPNELRLDEGWVDHGARPQVQDVRLAVQVNLQRLRQKRVLEIDGLTILVLDAGFERPRRATDALDHLARIGCLTGGEAPLQGKQRAVEVGGRRPGADAGPARV